jgi:hypothetical protein
VDRRRRAREQFLGPFFGEPWERRERDSLRRYFDAFAVLARRDK